MRAIRQIIPFFLLLSLTVTGIPFFCAQDANRDRKIDLQDAIILVKGVAGTAAEPGPFDAQVTNAVTALHEVAQMVTTITGEDSSAASIHSASLGVYLLSGNSENSTVPIWGRMASSTSSFTSITPVPDPHPPRA